jgi:hypothetical protein
MSQICYQQISLQSLVESSQLIVVVHPAHPPSSIEEIPIEAPPSDPDRPPLIISQKPIPPFRKIILHLVVEEVLLNRTGREYALGGTIAAARANWQNKLQAHIAYFETGMSKSPIYRQYQGSHTDAEPSFMAFLVSGQAGLRLAFNGAFESLTQRQAVLDAIENCQSLAQTAGSKRPGFWARLFAGKS